MSRIYLPWNASKARQRDAERARQNRAEIVRELSWGRVSRRDLIKWGCSPSAGHAGADRRAEPVRRQRVGRRRHSDRRAAQPAVRRQAVHAADAALRRAAAQPAVVPDADAAGGSEPDADAGRPDARRRLGPVRRAAAGPGVGAPALRRVPAAASASRRRRRRRRPTTSYNPQVRVEPELGHRSGARRCRCGSIPSCRSRTRTRSGRSTARSRRSWCMGRYGEPILFRHHNGLPVDVTQNSGFGRHTISTHEHNGHHGAENDGFTGAFFFPASSTTTTGRSCSPGTSRDQHRRDRSAWPARPDDSGGLDQRARATGTRR